MSHAYPVELVVVEDGAIMATFPDLGGVTQGDDEAEALEEAQDLLVEILKGKIAHGEEIRAASPADGRPLVNVPPVLAAKVELYSAWREAGISRAELARRLGWHAPQVARLFDVDHNSRIDQVDLALNALGRRLVVSTVRFGDERRPAAPHIRSPGRPSPPLAVDPRSGEGEETLPR